MLPSGIRRGNRRGNARRAAVDGTLVRVRGGYSPDVVYARAGAPIRIAFLREETAPCSEQVVFPAFGKTTTLQPGRTTVVDLPPSEPGTYEFTCALKMLLGSLIVEGR